MAITSKEYIHLLEHADTLMMINYTPEIIDIFDDLRKLHNKYIREAFYHHWYPKVNVEKEIVPYLADVINYCKDYDIEIKYNMLTPETHSSGEYCYYNFRGVDITKLIDLYPGQKNFKYS